MKKVLLTLYAIAGTALVGVAQDYGFNKGNVMLEGSFQASTVKPTAETSKTTSLQFSPKFGYFLSDKFALGVDLNVSSRTEKNTFGVSGINSESKQNTFGIGGFGRYYMLEVGSRFKAYTELGLGFLSNRDKSSIPNERFYDIKSSGFRTGAGIGANFFLNNNIAVNFLFADLIAYQTLKPDLPNAESNSQFSANFNVFNNFFNSSRFGLTFKF
ncbi:hypothetical protein ACFSQ3_00880 [Sphingobacterium corticis]|uniref:Outer membrane protein beta-barrel domain-containing protein n=1 Tax=Sphingobacterium corticis TaxID=1812823 RepID=A0ABW5NHX9_9SPHI